MHGPTFYGATNPAVSDNLRIPYENSKMNPSVVPKNSIFVALFCHMSDVEKFYISTCLSCEGIWDYPK